MAQNKKSFIAYADWLETFEECSDEEAGKLVKHLFRYVNDLNPEAPDRLTKMLFLAFKRALKSDLKKYEEIKKKRSEAGKEGAKQKKAKQANAKSVKQSKAKQADSVTVNDNVTVNDSEFFKNAELNSAFLDFIEHRKQLKKPMTELATTKAVNKLNKFNSEDAIKMIENSIEGGWSGLFELKQEQKKKTEDSRYHIDKNGNRILKGVL